MDTALIHHMVMLVLLTSAIGCSESKDTLRQIDDEGGVALNQAMVMRAILSIDREESKLAYPASIWSCQYNLSDLSGRIGRQITMFLLVPSRQILVTSL